MLVKKVIPIFLDTQIVHFDLVFLFSRMTQKAIEMKIKCIPLLFSTLIIKKRIYNNTTEFPEICYHLDKRTEYDLREVFYYQVKPICKRKCITTNYEANLELSQEDGIPTNAIGLCYWFPSNQLEVRKQYLIYDFNGFIGFVGGTLGLFIGFSFFDFCIYLGTFLKSILLPLIKKSWMQFKRSDSAVTM